MSSLPRVLLLVAAVVLVASCTKASADDPSTIAPPTAETPPVQNDLSANTMPNGAPHYLEIVTPSVDEVCSLYGSASGLEFSEPVQNLGSARVAELPTGALLGVRAPMRPDEGPLWRIYLRVDDLDGAVESARAAGAEIAIERMSLGDEHGDIAIVILGGIEHGYWQP